MLGECVVCLFVTSSLVLEDKLEVKSPLVLEFGHFIEENNIRSQIYKEH